MSITPRPEEPAGDVPFPRLDRRGFLARAALLPLCGLAGCASLATIPVRPADGRVRLSLSSYPALRDGRGEVRLAPAGGPERVYVMALEGGGWAALSPTCTHQGCTVDISGSRLVCPCHGSTYDREGQVLRGPAERALRRFPVRLLDGDTLEIDLR